MCVRCGTGRIVWCTDPYRHGESAEPVSPGDPPAVAETRTPWEAENPLLAWEDPGPVQDGPHAGHRTHSHPWHGMHVVMCQCGATLGTGCVAIDPDSPPAEPGPCPVCTARGMPLQGR